MPKEYFDDLMVNRQRLLWTVGVRSQLERWEHLVAQRIRSDLGQSGPTFADAEIWQTQIEHHFLLIAVRNLFQALDLKAPSPVDVDSDMRAELIEGRDLHEHWRENMPIFNVTPRQEQPKYPSGKSFAARYPDRGPYWWLGWTSARGAMVMPNVSATAVHQMLDKIEASVVVSDPSLRRFVRERQESPWIRVDDQYWPRSAVD